MALLTQGPVDGPVKTYIPDGAVTAGYAAVAGSVAGHATVAGAAGAQIVGVFEQTLASGAPHVRVKRHGDSLGVAGAAIAYGQYVKTNAAGKFIPVTGPAGSGENVAGRSESVATADGDQFVLFIQPFVY